MRSLAFTQIMKNKKKFRFNREQFGGNLMDFCFCDHDELRIRPSTRKRPPYDKHISFVLQGRNTNIVFFATNSTNTSKFLLYALLASRIGFSIRTT